MSPEFFVKAWLTPILVFLFFLFNYLLTISLPVDLVLDLKFMYSPQVILDSLSQMDEQGRAAYAEGILYLDLPYVIVYTVLFYTLLQKLWSGRHLCILTLSIAAMDTCENFLMLYHIRSFPDISDALGYLTSVFTSVKWLLVVILLGLVFAGLLRKILFSKESHSKAH